MVKFWLSATPVGWSSKKYLIRVARPTVFMGKKTIKTWVGESGNSNITVFYYVKGKNSNKHMSLVQKDNPSMHY